MGVELHLEQAVCPAAINHDRAMLFMYLLHKWWQLVPVVSCKQAVAPLGLRMHLKGWHELLQSANNLQRCRTVSEMSAIHKVTWGSMPCHCCWWCP